MSQKHVPYKVTLGIKFDFKNIPDSTQAFCDQEDDRNLQGPHQTARACQG